MINIMAFCINNKYWLFIFIAKQIALSLVQLIRWADAFRISSKHHVSQSWLAALRAAEYYNNQDLIALNLGGRFSWWYLDFFNLSLFSEELDSILEMDLLLEGWIYELIQEIRQLEELVGVDMGKEWVGTLRPPLEPLRAHSLLLDI